jgi:proteasome lid subunit RPN8/RPN11
MDSDNRDEKERKPTWQRSEDDRQIEAEAYHIWTPRPLIRSVYWRPEEEPPRESVSGSYEVFVDQRAFTGMHDHVWHASFDESPFGYLVGDLCEDPTANRRFVIVTQVIPSRFPFREADSEQISGEASVAMQLEVERKRGVLVGWYHSHPGGAPELTPNDVATHERLFPDPWQIAILFITDPRRPTGATFRRTPAGLDGGLPLPFYEMVTNESLLAKGVRRSRVDWENVSTLDKVRAEPPPRPEPPALDPESEPAPDSGPAPDAGPARDPEPTGEVASEPDPEPGSEPLVEPLGGSEAESVEAADGREPAPPEAPAKEAEAAEADELDFDTLIAEVESAGLDPELPGSEAEPEEVRFEETEREIETESGSGFEDVFEALSEVEEDLAAAERARRQGGSPSRGIGPAGSAEEQPKAGDEVTTPEPTGDEEARPGTGVRDESAADDTEEGAASVPIAEPKAEEEAVGPHDTSVEIATEPTESGAGQESGGAGLRRWALPVLGILIAVAVIAVLTRGFGGGAETESVVRPNAAESTPVAEDAAPPIADSSAAAAVTDSAFDETAGEGAEGAAGRTEPAAGARDDAGEESAAGSGVAGIELTDSAAAPEPVPIETLRSLSDTVVQSISTFYGRSGAFDRGEIECPELQASFVEVMDSWIDYSTRGRAGWQGRMPPDVEVRDERLYLGVQDVERLFEGSSCPRP